jgi:hypothetical protein
MVLSCSNSSRDCKWTPRYLASPVWSLRCRLSRFDRSKVRPHAGNWQASRSSAPPASDPASASLRTLPGLVRSDSRSDMVPPDPDCWSFRGGSGV